MFKAFRKSGRRLIAGVLLAGLSFQTAVLAAHFSNLAVTSIDGSGELLTGVICSSDGSAVPPADHGPAKTAGTCAFCPFCGNSGSGDPGFLPDIAPIVFEPGSQNAIFYASVHCCLSGYADRPRSRGPPSII